MQILLDGDPLLNTTLISNIGSDTVIILNKSNNSLYICAHLKDYKPLEDDNGSFTKQMKTIINIINNNKDKCIILMLDANTQFEIEKNIINVFSKNGEKDRKKFIFNDDIKITGIISKFPTSYKMRGSHTAQLNKSLDQISAIIDHIIIFNGPDVYETNAFILDKTNNLYNIKNNMTLTTSPNSIVDHALVISTLKNGISYGSLNIKGGNIEDNAWAEFVPELYYNFFKNPIVKERLFNILLDTFDKYTLAEIKDKNFLSKPRCRIFDIHLPNNIVPYITIYGSSIIITSNDINYILLIDIDGNYSKPIIPIELNKWFDCLIDDLNSKENNFERRNMFLDRGYLLLNFWYYIQKDKIIIIDDKSFNIIYDEIYQASIKKVSIGYIIMKAKLLYPNLHVISLQEMPIIQNEVNFIINDIKENIKSIGYTVNIYMNDISTGPTQGAIVAFE
jgi:hypothetical protein